MLVIQFFSCDFINCSAILVFVLTSRPPSCNWVRWLERVCDDRVRKAPCPLFVACSSGREAGLHTPGQLIFLLCTCAICPVGSFLLLPPHAPQLGSCPASGHGCSHHFRRETLEALEATSSVSVKMYLFTLRVCLNSVWFILFRNVCHYFLDGSLKKFQWC